MEEEPISATKEGTLEMLREMERSLLSGISDVWTGGEQDLQAAIEQLEAKFRDPERDYNRV